MLLPAGCKVLWQEAAPQGTNLETFSVHLVLKKTKVVNTKSSVLVSVRLITEYLWKTGTQVLNSNFKRARVSPACCKQIFTDSFELKLRENLCGDYHNRCLDISCNFEKLHSEWDGKIS